MLQVLCIWWFLGFFTCIWNPGELRLINVSVLGCFRSLVFKCQSDWDPDFKTTSKTVFQTKKGVGATVVESILVVYIFENSEGFQPLLFWLEV